MADDNHDSDGVQVRAELTPDGRFEIGDPVPMAPPVDFRPPPTMIEMIRQYVRHELSGVAQDAGFETFEESDDFVLEDDEGSWDGKTPYEAVFDPPVHVPPNGAGAGGDAGKRAPQDAASKEQAVAAPSPAPSMTPATVDDAVKDTQPVVKRSEP